MLTRHHILIATAASLLLHAGVLLVWPPGIDVPDAGAPLIHVAVSAPPQEPAPTPSSKTPPQRPQVRQRKHTPAAPVPRQPAEAPRRQAAESPRREDAQTTADNPQTAASRTQPALLARKNITVYLHRAVTANFRYPALARRQGWQGRVKLAMHIEADGRLTALRVQQSSGHRILDQAALQTLQAIRNIPEAVSWLQGHALDIVLPVEYRLLDS